MDLIKFIKSLEELLYEVATWLLFYPRTLWLALVRPSSLARYTESELDVPIESQFTDVVSPPMFLLLTLLLAHGLELVADPPATEHASAIIKRIYESDTNLLIFRSIADCIYPLLMARALLARLGGRIDRESLRRPFYAQCFLIAPYVILTAIAEALRDSGIPAASIGGSALWAGAVVWYLRAEGQWFARRLGVSFARGLGTATANFAASSLVIFIAVGVMAAPEILAALKAK